MLVLKPILTSKELPEDDNKYYIVRYNGTGSWHQDKVDELQGSAIKANRDKIKIWYKEVEK